MPGKIRAIHPNAVNALYTYLTLYIELEQRHGKDFNIFIHQSKSSKIPEDAEDNADR